MDVWIGVLGFVLFLGFSIAVLVCVNAMKKSATITIKSRLHQSFGTRDVVYANLGLIAGTVLLVLHMYTFVPGCFMFAIFVVFSTSIKSGLTDEGAVIGTVFLEWDEMNSYKLVNDEHDSNIIILKIRANHKQYVLVCNREDRYEIAALMREKNIKTTEVDASANDTWSDRNLSYEDEVAENIENSEISETIET